MTPSSSVSPGFGIPSPFPWLCPSLSSSIATCWKERNAASSTVKTVAVPRNGITFIPVAAIATGAVVDSKEAFTRAIPASSVHPQPRSTPFWLRPTRTPASGVCPAASRTATSMKLVPCGIVAG